MPSMRVTYQMLGGIMAMTRDSAFSIRNSRVFITVVCCSLTIIGASSLHAQTTSPADADLKHAEGKYTHDLAKPSLHTRDTFPDGAKGYAVEDPHQPQSPNVYIPPQFKSADDFAAYTAECNADALVVGKLLNSTPILMSTKSGILTLSRFSVTAVIKPDGSVVPGQTIVTFRQGGEVSDANEVLRVETPSAPAYKLGSSYLLELTMDAGAKAPQYFTPQFGTISVRGGRVYLSSGHWAGFLSGSSYSDIVKKLQEAEKLPCNINR
jgi:hypothetical protein